MALTVKNASVYILGERYKSRAIFVAHRHLLHPTNTLMKGVPQAVVGLVTVLTRPSPLVGVVV